MIAIAFRKKVLSLILVTAFVLMGSLMPLRAQELMWAVQAGGAGDDEGRSIAVDKVGNCYVAGSFDGEAIFGNGQQNQTTLVSDGGDDGYLAKFDPNGIFVWAKAFQGGSSSHAWSVTVDVTGSIYVAGRFEGTITIEKGTGNETSLTTTGGSANIFLAKYSTEGVLSWIKQAVASDAVDSATDEFSNYYITGRFIGTAIFGLNGNREFL